VTKRTVPEAPYDTYYKTRSFGMQDPSLVALKIDRPTPQTFCFHELLQVLELFSFNTVIQTSDI